MAEPFTEVRILPSYAKGFTFLWDVSDGFSDPLPWTFTIEEGPSDEGPWTEIAGPIVNQFAYVEPFTKRVVSKDLVLFFRIKLVTPTATYYSQVKHPYGDLDRREYLIARDIMRREILQQRGMAAVPAKLWIKSTFAGAPCTVCVDPITGDPVNSNCKDCFGTGRIPPYHGPYDIWATFSPTSRNTELKPDGTGLQQVYSWTIRIIGFPFIKDQDIIIDVRADKRFNVDGVQHLTELRRIPIVQQVRALELPTSDPAYKVGEELPEEEEGCVLP